MKKIAMYLAGSIQKGHERNDETYWTEEHMDLLRQKLAPWEVSFLNPAWRTDDLTDQHSVFGRDMTQVFCSDLVLVDARDRRGLGVGAEMMWAKVNRIPVVSWAPQNSHYHKSSTTLLGVSVEDWVHPFVESLSDKLVEDLGEAARWILSELLSGRVKVKGVEQMESAMQHYRQTQFDRDVPMQQLFTAHPVLQERATRPVFVSDIR